MIVKLEEHKNQKEIEVLIKYARMSPLIKKLEKIIKSVDKTIKCTLDNSIVWVNASDIYYIEVVDKRTFVYGEKLVYETNYRLYQLLNELSDFGFVQISKSCILNIHYLDSIKPLINSRLQATLRNGEHIYVTRKYVSEIHKKLQGR
ncbi:MAG: LytTR family transcriptional regulator [Epulopiscium sp.]|jgi:DNA-binding LytR/AlgR family response regulator|nr:LytTR family transcriptional regulator [Candidatus Epulonipiscium sp.]HOQ16651.1 LytTR family DNA-binding domain-containing protein [Defluviitaleaceae bacterium]HPT75211.1 LytTR family DNA-binding domain-containing protein [Defluviitaleaceae bacterium]